MPAANADQGLLADPEPQVQARISRSARQSRVATDRGQDRRPPAFDYTQASPSITTCARLPQMGSRSISTASYARAIEIRQGDSAKRIPARDITPAARINAELWPQHAPRPRRYDKMPGLVRTYEGFNNRGDLLFAMAGFEPALADLPTSAGCSSKPGLASVQNPRVRPITA